MKLYIDSCDNLKTTIKIEDIVYTKTYQSPREQDVLGAIVECLNKQQINLNQISQIFVKVGQGSFTGTRVGVSIAQALSFSLGIPVNNQTTGGLESVSYESEPSITRNPQKLTQF